jgi:hypothetical protein
MVKTSLINVGIFAMPKVKHTKKCARVPSFGIGLPTFGIQLPP